MRRTLIALTMVLLGVLAVAPLSYADRTTPTVKRCVAAWNASAAARLKSYAAARRPTVAWMAAVPTARVAPWTCFFFASNHGRLVYSVALYPKVPIRWASFRAYALGQPQGRLVSVDAHGRIRLIS